MITNQIDVHRFYLTNSVPVIGNQSLFISNQIKTLIKKEN